MKGQRERGRDEGTEGGRGTELIDMKHSKGISKVQTIRFHHRYHLIFAKQYSYSTIDTITITTN